MHILGGDPNTRVLDSNNPEDRAFVEEKIGEILTEIAQEANKPDFEADAQRYRQALLKIAKHSSDQYAIDLALAALRLDATDL